MKKRKLREIFKILNWSAWTPYHPLCGLAYIAEGIISFITFGFINPPFGLMMAERIGRYRYRRDQKKRRQNA